MHIRTSLLLLNAAFALHALLIIDPRPTSTAPHGMFDSIGRTPKPTSAPRLARQETTIPLSDIPSTCGTLSGNTAGYKVCNPGSSCLPLNPIISNSWIFACCAYTDESICESTAVACLGWDDNNLPAGQSTSTISLGTLLCGNVEEECYDALLGMSEGSTILTATSYYCGTATSTTTITTTSTSTSTDTVVYSTSTQTASTSTGTGSVSYVTTTTSTFTNTGTLQVTDTTVVTPSGSRFTVTVVITSTTGILSSSSTSATTESSPITTTSAIATTTTPMTGTQGSQAASSQTSSGPSLAASLSTPTASTAAPSEDQVSHGHATYIPAIVGGVIGGLAAAAIVAAIWVISRKRKIRREAVWNPGNGKLDHDASHDSGLYSGHFSGQYGGHYTRPLSELQ